MIKMFVKRLVLSTHVEHGSHCEFSRINAIGSCEHTVTEAAGSEFTGSTLARSMDGQAECSEECDVEDGDHWTADIETTE